LLRGNIHNQTAESTKIDAFRRDSFAKPSRSGDFCRRHEEPIHRLFTIVA